MDGSIAIPFKAGGIELLAASFRCEGNEYQYSEVMHLSRYAKRTSVNFVPVHDHVDLEITVRDRAPLLVGNSGVPFTRGKVEKAFQALASSTFSYRASGYLEQLDESGYFEYGGAVFHADGEVRCSRQTANMNTAGFLRDPFELLIKPAGKGFFGKKMRVRTRVDPDVFDFLVHKLYHIRIS